MITDLKPYPTMKDSGVPSLGEVPVVELRARAEQGSEDLAHTCKGSYIAHQEEPIHGMDSSRQSEQIRH